MVTRGIFFTLLFLLVIFWGVPLLCSCGTVEPYVRPVCEVVEDICTYQSLLCDTNSFFSSPYTRGMVLDSLDRLGEELRVATEREDDR